jgi:hypothetical protein
MTNIYKRIQKIFKVGMIFYAALDFPDWFFGRTDFGKKASSILTAYKEGFTVL